MGCGQHLKILRGILVAVMLCAAGVAGPASLAESEGGVDHTADRAHLAAWVETIGNDDGALGKWCLVGELSTNLRHRGVHDGLGESRTCHPRDVQVFDADPAKTSHDACGKLVRHVASDVGDPFVQTSELRLGLLPVFAAFGSTRQLLIKPAQPLFVSTQSTRRLGLLTCGENGEVNDSEIYADHCLGFTTMRVDPGLSNLDLDRDIPVTGTLGEPRRENLARKTKLLPGADPAELGDLNAFAVELNSAFLDRESWRRVLFGLEARIAWFLTGLHTAKEVGEGHTKIAQRAIRYFPRKLSYPWEVNALDGIQLGVELLPRGLLAGFVLFLPAGEAPVEDEPRGPSTSLQPCCLSVVRIEPKSLAEYHASVSVRPWTALRATAAIGMPRRRAFSRSQAGQIENSGGAIKSMITYKEGFGKENTACS